MLESVQIAADAKITREHFLLNRTPKLQRYSNSKRNYSVAKCVHRKPTTKITKRTQTLVSRYIDIYDDVPVDLGNEWQRQMQERSIHLTTPEGDEEEDSRGKGTKRKRQKQAT